MTTANPPRQQATERAPWNKGHLIGPRPWRGADRPKAEGHPAYTDVRYREVIAGAPEKAVKALCPRVRRSVD